MDTQTEIRIIHNCFEIFYVNREIFLKPSKINF